MPVRVMRSVRSKGSDSRKLVATPKQKFVITHGEEICARVIVTKTGHISMSGKCPKLFLTPTGVSRISSVLELVGSEIARLFVLLGPPRYDESQIVGLGRTRLQIGSTDG